MPFDVSTVTLKGAELLAAATAQNRLIIDGCDADTAILTQAQAAQISARPASPLSTTTDVTQLGSNVGHVNSRVYFRAGTNPGGDAHSLYLYAHSESDPSNVYVIFVASATDSFHIPEAGDVVNEYQAALDIVYTVATDSVGYATQATYCNLSEFNLLKERTVTTHKEGEPTVGENQTIYGDKTFRGLVEIKNLGVRSSFASFCAADFLDDVSVTGDATFRGDIVANETGKTAKFNDVEVTGDLSVSGNTISASNSIAEFNRVNAPQICATSGYRIEVTRGGQSVTPAFVWYNSDDPDNAAAIIEDCKVNAYSIKSDTSYSIKDYGQSTYSAVIEQNDTDPENAKAIVQNCKVSAYSVTATNSISCPTGVISGLGVSVGTVGLTGLHPTVSSGTVNVPIGGIVAVYTSAFVIGQGSGLNAITIGEIITVGVSDSIYAAKWNSDSGEWEQGKQLPSNALYVALSDASSLSGINYNGMLLVVRTA